MQPAARPAPYERDGSLAAAGGDGAARSCGSGRSASCASCEDACVTRSAPRLAAVGARSSLDRRGDTVVAGGASAHARRLPRGASRARRDTSPGGARPCRSTHPTWRRGASRRSGRRFPAAPECAVARADRIISGRYDLLGYRGLARREHRRTGTRTPSIGAARRGRTGPRALSRSGRAATTKSSGSSTGISTGWSLGAGVRLTGESRYHDAFSRAARATGSPPTRRSSASTGRACWSSRSGACRGSGRWNSSPAGIASGSRARGSSICCVALDRQLTHVEQNLSHYFSPNTHLLGRSAGAVRRWLRAAGAAASARRAAIGRTVLIQEATRQIRADGGHAELSAHYHRYSTDFYLLAARVAQRADDPAAAIFDEAARSRRATCARSATTPANGRSSATTTAGSCFRSAAGRRRLPRYARAAAAILLNDRPWRSARRPRRATGSAAPAAAAKMAVETHALAVDRLDRERLLRVAHARAAIIWSSMPARTGS